MDHARLYLPLLIGGLAIVASVGAARLASRAGLPVLLAYLGVGLILGEDVLGVDFGDERLAHDLGNAALAIILVEGGLATRWRSLRPVIAPAMLLATIGVVVSVGVTAAGAVLLIGTDWRLALLLGAIVASTDAAAVFSVLRSLPLPGRLAGLLEAESGFNDAPTVILVSVLSIGTLHWTTPLEVIYQLAIGAAIGLFTGGAGAWVLRRISLPSSGLYPIAAFGAGIVAFGAAGFAHGSGFLAAYLAGILLGNSSLPHRRAVQSFAEGLGWVAQIGLFVMLGLLVTPHELPAVILPALLVGGVLLLAARPLSIAVSLLPWRLPWREQIFLSWAGLRGAVPIVLATIPVVNGVPGSERLFNIVFVLVVAFTLIQGPTLPWLARRLGLSSPDPIQDMQVESAPLDALAADLLYLSVTPGSRLHGCEVYELRLPAPAAVTLVVRDGDAFVPSRDTRLRLGDELLVVTGAANREEVEARIRSVAESGALARWYARRRKS
ncbi:potassium/proton antiporter [Longispora albida]|uniref:potassium/proton antiporter n=1 Tax=Longispora albida TaxID=203523 RepID=UPI00036AF0C2|nr:potassium/proton antiporter [Longispora albida]